MEKINELKMKLLINLFCEEIEKFLQSVKGKVLNDEGLDDDDFTKIVALNNIIWKEAEQLVETDEQKSILSGIEFTLDLIGLAITNDLRNGGKYTEMSRIDNTLYLLKKVSKDLNKLMNTYKNEEGAA